MNVTTFASLLGGTGLFLLGMRMMTDGLKLAAGNALRSILHSWTRTVFRGLLAGVLITAIVQSSSAVTVATVGFVNAGLMTLAQAVWVVFGTNVGTTMTGWLVALVGIKIDVGALALPLLGVGMLTRMVAGSNVRRAGFGEAVAGFGAFFLGVGILQGAFSELAPRISEWPLDALGPAAVFAFVGVGTLLTLLTQSSSAAIAITLTASAGGSVPVELAAATVIGTNIGTTSTAFFAALGATPPARRVAAAHIAFNLLTGAIALAMLPWLLAASTSLVRLWSPDGDLVTSLAVFHTLFNVLGILLMWPTAAWLVRFLSRRFVSAEEELGRPGHLDPTLAGVPALALRGLVLELQRMSEAAFSLAADRIRSVSTEPEGRQRQEGVVRLGQAIRAFIGNLSAVPLPEDVVAALPDLLRASQHLDELAAESGQLGRARPQLQPEGSPTNAIGTHDRTKLTEVVLASLALEESNRSAPEVGELTRQLTFAYEGLKTALLRASAQGRLRVDMAEEELFRARRLKRIGEAALKARRRLASWIEPRDRVATLELGTAAAAQPVPALGPAVPTGAQARTDTTRLDSG